MTRKEWLEQVAERSGGMVAYYFRKMQEDNKPLVDDWDIPEAILHARIAGHFGNLALSAQMEAQ